MSILSIFVRAVALWVVVGTTGLAFWARGLDGRRLGTARVHREVRWMRGVRWSVRAGQLVLAASPLFVERTPGGWLLVGALWGIVIATEWVLNGVREPLAGGE